MGNIFVTAIIVCTTIAIGFYFTIKLNFIQIRELKTGLIEMFKVNQSDEGVSSFSAAILAVSGRIGSGNVAGVVLAIYLCGYGVLFWFWIASFLAMATAFVETTLAQVYKKKEDDVTYISGPMAYIERGLPKFKYLGLIYSFLLILTVGIVYILIHMNVISKTVLAFAGVSADIFLEMVVALLISIILAYIVGTGKKRIIQTLSYLIPVMLLTFFVLVGIITVSNFKFIPQFYSLVFENAFTVKSTLGGSILSVIAIATSLTTLSSEAGLGTSTIAGGLSYGTHPATQGFVNMLTILLDAIICSMSAFVLIFALESDSMLIDINNTSDLAIHAFEYAYSGGGILILNFILIFSFSTILTSITYCLQTIRYLTLKKSTKLYNRIKYTYLAIVLIVIFVSPFVKLSSSLMISLIIFASISLLLINVFSIFMLRKVAFATYHNYKRGIKRFRASDIDIDFSDDENDIWI